MLSPLREIYLYSSKYTQRVYQTQRKLNYFLTKWETSKRKMEVIEIHNCQSQKIYKELDFILNNLRKVYKSEPFYFLYNLN